jgi:predicted GNAT family N-acyltransferase
MRVHVVPVEWNSHRDALRGLREKVFIIEQGVPRELEWDGEDERSHHFIALNEAGQALGCARLLPSGQIGRMAVLAEHRQHGIGMRLLVEAIEAAKRLGFARVMLHAQTHATTFYRKAGFEPVGEIFMEAGIPHQEMFLDLPIPFESTGAPARPSIRPHAAANPPSPMISQVEQYRGETECRDGLLRHLDQPVRKLWIFSPHLDPVLFDTEPLAAAVLRFVRSSASAQVRILICDNAFIVGRHHRLAELAKRLDSRIALRKLDADLAPGTNCFVTWDDTGFFLLPDFREYVAVADRYDRVQAQRFSERYARLWEQGAVDPELRRLTV